MTVLSAVGLAKAYASPSNLVQRAIDGVSLEIERGEFVALMGPSGSGKTTLLNLLALVDRPDAGAVSICGQDALRLAGNALSDFRRKQVGMVFQDACLIDTMTLGENVVLPLLLGRVEGRAVSERSRELAAALRIADIMDRYPSEVSGGQRQRAAVARALACAPVLLLADEPTGALDSRSGRELMELFCERNESEGAAMLMATHDPFAASWARRVVFLYDGRVFTEITRSGERRAFFERIIEVQAAMEGGVR
jgi:putative ABC transport system ATP-binding protein